MNLILLNISASIMILTTLFIHKIFKKHVPHGVFCILWLVIILRLFFPIKLETRLSLWNLIIKSEHVVADFTNLPISHGYTTITDFVQNNSFVITPIYKIIWCTVCSAVGIFFLSQYIKTLKAIKTSSYINDNFINDVISRQNFYRHVNIKSMKGISSPSTLGIIRPTILFPENFDFGDRDTLECILLHETGHGTRQHRNDAELLRPRYFPFRTGGNGTAASQAGACGGKRQGSQGCISSTQNLLLLLLLLRVKT